MTNRSRVAQGADLEPAQRIGRLSRRIAKAGLDALLVVHPVNRFYLTGFRSTEGLLVVHGDGKAEFLADFRYVEMARKDIDPAAARVRLFQDAPRSLGAMAKRGKWKRVGFEGSIPVAQLHRFKKALPGVGWWVESEKPILDLRARKSRFEQSLIRRAARLGDEAFKRTVAEIELGMTEWDVRRILRGWIDRLDAEGESFGCIVSVGSNASKPHAHVTRRPLRRGQVLLIDMGVVLDGYCSDMTRVAFLGKPSATMRKIYDIVHDAQLRALDAVRAGRTGRQVDAVARRYVERKGYGKYFGHGLGHGVGLEIHEAPRLAKESGEVLEPGMIVTVEPGIYLPGVGGVRIEDMVIVRRDGCEILTQTPKDPIVLEG
ncbi:aminopeptidase P family protein [Candidatus Sumerlaeota bacterium]|nr:aminopeptidase P family protein [Candidatus Sumerlaeota bacterium]